MSSEFRSLPSVDAVLSDRRVRRLVDEYSHGAVLGLVRAWLDDARGAIADGGSAPGLDELVSGIAGDTASLWRAWPSQVINATGVVLHTNLVAGAAEQGGRGGCAAGGGGLFGLGAGPGDGSAAAPGRRTCSGCCAS